MVEVFEDKYYIYIVMEYCDIDLYEYTLQNTKGEGLSETEAIKILY